MRENGDLRTPEDRARGCPFKPVGLGRHVPKKLVKKVKLEKKLGFDRYVRRSVNETRYDDRMRARVSKGNAIDDLPLR
uniref:Uncharacterized protein n=1 Tax=Steinernema glaseri TaxID=37863 RepID=A0A1I7YZA4_9BILA